MKIILRFLKLIIIFFLFLAIRLEGYSCTFYFAPNDTLLKFGKEDVVKIDKADKQIASADELIKEALTFDAQIKDLKSQDIEKKNSKIQGKIDGLQDKSIKNREQASKNFTEAYNTKYEIYKTYARKTYNSFKGTKDKLSKGKEYEDDAQADLKQAKGIRKEIQTYTNRRVVAFRLGEADDLEKKAMEKELMAYQYYVSNPNDGSKGLQSVSINNSRVDTVKKLSVLAVDSQKINNKNSTSKNIGLDTIPKTIVKNSNSGKVGSRDSITKPIIKKSELQKDTQRLVTQTNSGKTKKINTKTIKPVSTNVIPIDTQKVISTYRANNNNDTLKKKPVDNNETGEWVDVTSKNISIPQNYYDSVKVDYNHIEMFKQFLAEKHMADAVKYKAGVLGDVRPNMESIQSAWYSYAFEADTYYDSLNNALAKETEKEVNNIVNKEQNKEITVNNISNSNFNSYSQKSNGGTNNIKPDNSKITDNSNGLQSDINSEKNDENVNKSKGKNLSSQKDKINSDQGDIKDITESYGSVDKINSNSNTVSKINPDYSGTSKITKANFSEGINYVVQIAACRAHISKGLLDSLYSGNKPVAMVYEDKWYKYSVGKFNSFKDANNLKKQITVHGAFIVAYLNGNKLELYKAMQLTGESNNSGNRTSIPQIDNSKEKVVFRVQVAASKSPIPTSILKLIYAGQHEVSLIREDNWFKYSIDGGNSYHDAFEMKNNIHVDGAFIVAYRNGQKLKITGAIKTIKQ